MIREEKTLLANIDPCSCGTFWLIIVHGQGGTRFTKNFKINYSPERFIKDNLPQLVKRDSKNQIFINRYHESKILDCVDRFHLCTDLNSKTDLDNVTIVAEFCENKQTNILFEVPYSEEQENVIGEEDHSFKEGHEDQEVYQDNEGTNSTQLSEELVSAVYNRATWVLLAIEAALFVAVTVFIVWLSKCKRTKIIVQETVNIPMSQTKKKPVHNMYQGQDYGYYEAEARMEEAL